ALVGPEQAGREMDLRPDVGELAEQEEGGYAGEQADREQRAADDLDAADEQQPGDRRHDRVIAEQRLGERLGAGSVDAPLGEAMRDGDDAGGDAQHRPGEFRKRVGDAGDSRDEPAGSGKRVRHVGLHYLLGPLYRIYVRLKEAALARWRGRVGRG